MSSETSSASGNEQRTDAQDHGKTHETSGELTDRTNDKGRSIAEWITFAISLAILISVVGTITWLSFRGEDRPPVITVEVQMDQLRQEESGYYLPVLVRNGGNDTVEDAVIQGELDTGEGQPETVDLTVTFLAGGEEINATLVFRDDPSAGELTTGVISYKEP
jgi:uncharacterized protein (TIGR02588 family)